MKEAATQDFVNQTRLSVNIDKEDTKEWVKVTRSPTIDVAVFEILFIRPSRPIMMSIEDFMHVTMDNLDLTSLDIG
jgi:hypothetical protein